jgi:hypothetical protein
MLEDMKREIKGKSVGDGGLKERERIKAKISGLNSQLDALTERLSMLPKSISPTSFFKQMEKIELLKQDFEQKLLNENKVELMPINRFVHEKTFEDFAKNWKQHLNSASEELKKKIIPKFIRKIGVGKNEVTIHWLVDEEHYKMELALTANSSLFVARGSQSLKNGAPK